MIDSTNSKTKALWYYEAFSPLNWKISTFDFTTYTQTFTSIESGKNCDLRMIFQKGKFLIEYFENNATVPTRSKTIKSRFFKDSDIMFILKFHLKKTWNILLPTL